MQMSSPWLKRFFEQAGMRLSYVMLTGYRWEEHYATFEEAIRAFTNETLAECAESIVMLPEEDLRAAQNGDLDGLHRLASVAVQAGIG
jgi:hypothetical protein